MLKIGKYVTRKKYDNDILFKIIDIRGNKYILKGVDIRLVADSQEDDLIECKYCKKKEIYEEVRKLNTDSYFYIPGTILHIDTDEEYKDKCDEYYRSQKLKYNSLTLNILEYKKKIIGLIKKYNPNIIVITGHDAYYKKDNKYLNSKYYIEAVSEIRKSSEYNNIIVIAGACQSNYEELIKSGSTYASSPTHSNIHALDPAIIASFIALSSINKEIDIKEILSKTKYGSKGFGGIMTNGKMKIGYPRKDNNEYW